MSITHTDPSFDSGHNHIKPLLVALLIVAVTVAVSLAFSGLPH